MSMTLAVTGVAFAAFCVWFTVRIVNRRERWAKWTFVVVAVALAYSLSFGPACWIHHWTGTGGWAIARIYAPAGSYIAMTSPFVHH